MADVKAAPKEDKTNKITGSSKTGLKGKKMEIGNAYLQFVYYDADKKEQPLPKGTPVNIYFVDKKGERYGHSKNPIKIENSEGKISFKVERPKYALTFAVEFPDDKAEYFINTGKKEIMTRKELDAALKSDPLYLTKVQLFKIPARLDPAKTSWTVSDSCKFYDRASRSFKDLDKPENELKGKKKGSYLPVYLHPEWQHISFCYFEPAGATKDTAVPQGILLSGYNEQISEDVPAAVSALYHPKKKCWLLPWFETASRAATRNKKKIVLKFETGNMFVEKGNKIVRLAVEDVLKKPLPERKKYFDLPKKWSSKNWVAVLDGKTDKVEELLNKTTTADKPLTFYLDAIVAADEDLESEEWGGQKRFTAFDDRLVIQKPDAGEPYWSEGEIKHQFIVPDTAVRVVAHDGKIYDVTHKRTEDGDIIGARAAVQEDEDCHHGEALVEPVCDAGNFELHYFNGCLDPGGKKEASYLMIYWSCEFALDGSTGATEADVDKFRQDGLASAKKFWEKNQYVFEYKDDPNNKKLTVYPVFFFEGRRDDKFKCSVNIIKRDNFRSNMGINTATFERRTYNSTVICHELGHGVGLDDEYAESIAEAGGYNPTLPRFTTDQYYDGMPYFTDKPSIMCWTKVPRVRHLWHFCSWMNDTDEVKELTANTTFRVATTKGTAYKYFLEDKYKNIYKSKINEKNVTVNGDVEYDLFLYKLGQDELTDLLLKKVKVDAILVVRLKLQWFFSDYSDAKWTVDWEAQDKRDYLLYFQTEIDQKFNKRFYLKCSDASAKDFKNIYVYFNPHYAIEGWTTADHCEITVKQNPNHKTGKVKHKADFEKKDFDDCDFTVDVYQDCHSIMRYVLGMSPYNNKKTEAGDLKKIKSWVEGKLSLKYTVEKVK